MDASVIKAVEGLALTRPKAKHSSIFLEKNVTDEAVGSELQAEKTLELFATASTDCISMTTALAHLHTLGIDRATSHAFFTLWLDMDKKKKEIAFTYIKFSLRDPVGVQLWMDGQLDQAAQGRC